MNKPYFSVGEEVILVSETYSEYNGEQRIKHVLYYGDSFFDRIAEENTKRIPTNYNGKPFYILEEIIPNENNTTEIAFKQTALRKKHQPSEMNFNELMSSLNAPITTW